VGHGGGQLTAAQGRYVGEKSVADTAAYVREGVSIKKEKRGSLVEFPEKIE